MLQVLKIKTKMFNRDEVDVIKKLITVIQIVNTYIKKAENDKNFSSRLDIDENIMNLYKSMFPKTYTLNKKFINNLLDEGLKNYYKKGEIANKFHLFNYDKKTIDLCNSIIEFLAKSIHEDLDTLNSEFDKKQDENFINRIKRIRSYSKSILDNNILGK